MTEKGKRVEMFLTDFHFLVWGKRDLCQFYYHCLEQSFLSQAIVHAPESIDSAAEYGMCRVIRRKTRKINKEPSLIIFQLNSVFLSKKKRWRRLTKKNILCWNPLWLYFCKQPCLINLRPSWTKLSNPLMSLCNSQSCTMFSCVAKKKCQDIKFFVNVVWK